MSETAIRELYRRGVAELESAGIASAASEVRLLLSAACAVPPAELALSERAAPPAGAARFGEYLRRRLAREPAQYILGKAYFYDAEFRVTSDVLIPRPETELLVERVLEVLPERGKLLDLGTGSGAIAVTAARHRPDAEVTAADLSPAALEVAARNARELGAPQVEFVRSDLFSDLAERRFDVVAANLPYVPEEDRPLLAPEVSECEPGLALFAADGGFAVIGRALEELREHLCGHGFAIFELDPRQAERARGELEKRGFDAVVRRDLAGRERFVEGRLP